MSITSVNKGDEYVLRTQVGEDNSMVHDTTIAWELSKIMLLPLDVEEQRGHNLNDMMTRVYPSITKVSTLIVL